MSTILDRAFVDQKLYGVKIQCFATGISPDDERMFPIYEKIVEYDKILTIHAGTGPRRPSPATGCLLPMYHFDPRDVCGVKRFKTVLKRYPNLRCIFPHLGAEEFEEFYDLMREYKNLWTDTAAILSGFFPFKVNPENLIEFQDRALYGSDTPSMPYELDTEIKCLKSLALGKEVEEKILYGNARRLFNLSRTAC